MQFNRDEAGVMHPLPKPSVDTGMGLERISAVLQHVHSNYEIDLFVQLIEEAKQAVDAALGNAEIDSPSLKVIADHIRACSFLIADGVIPGNEGRGYVLRRIARRAIRHGYKLGAREPFFHSLVRPLLNEMGDAFPELRINFGRIFSVLKQEEERFFETIGNGMAILGSAISVENFALRWLQKKTGWTLDGLFVTGFSGMPYQFDGRFLANEEAIPAEVVVGEGDKASLDRIYQSVYTFKEKKHLEIKRMAVVVVGTGTIPALDSLVQGAGFSIQVFRVTDEELGEFRKLAGELAFKLHDTFGFPLDLTQDVCREQGVTVDVAAFDKAMAQQKDQARAAGKFKMAANLEYAGPATTFHGYELLESKANVLALYKDGVAINELNEGEMGVVVLDSTPFYAESGGQVGDSGVLHSTQGIFAVEDTQKIQASVFGHHGVMKTGKLAVEIGRAHV